MKRAVVSIVGRPNVGKSSLFNKLARKRIAITEDTPGVTRDRIYAEAEWQNRYFTLVDTGGLDTKSEDVFMSSIREQVEVAISMSDVILFVVDGREGLTSEDRKIAELLRNRQKEVILVVNKIDNRDLIDNFYEFYQLGFENTIDISAEGSRKLGDLLDLITDKFPTDVDTVYNPDILKVALIGKPNAGKSSMINKIVGDERVIVTDQPGTTRDAIDINFEYNGNDYIFIDTAGLRRKRSVEAGVERYSVVRTLNAIDRSSVAVLVIDALEGVTEQDTKIAGYAHENGKAIIIAINKWDLVEKDGNTIRDFENEIRRKLAFIYYAPIIFVSALTGQRLDELLELIEIVDNNYSLRISTGTLNNILNRAISIQQPPSDKGRNAKIYYSTQASTRPPKFLIFMKNKDLMHFSYTRFLENQIRNNFGFIGTPIKIEYKER